ncbi:MAG TPA: hypothetical protein VGI96_46510 [Streptosporangiaceae bacterium]
MDEGRSGGAQRGGPVLRDAVGVSGAGQRIAGGMPSSGIAVSTGVNAGTGSWRQGDRVMRRAGPGTAGPFSSGVMTAADR